MNVDLARIQFAFTSINAGGHYQRTWDSEHQPLLPRSLPGTTVPGGHRVYRRFRQIAHGGVCRQLPR